MRHLALAASLLAATALGAAACTTRAEGDDDAATAEEAAADTAASAGTMAAADPDQAAQGGGRLPTGWKARLDRANARLEDAKVSTMGNGLHFTTGPAAIYWNAEHQGRGNYTAEASFTMMKPSEHPEAYGLLVGGRDLEGAGQNYLYFLVRQDGSYLVKHRGGSETHDVIDWTKHEAVRTPGADGKATNALAIRVGADSVRFVVNGTQVAARPRSSPMLANLDGQVGLRVNHNLDVHVEGLRVEGQ
jgi:hypothetical protein